MTHSVPQRVNYDQIAHLYDEPGRDHATDPHLLRFLDEHPDLSPSQLRVLDMGCGTGKQLAADFKELPGLSLVGLDLYRGMLRLARQRCPAAAWVQGDSARPPFASGSFRYLTSQFSYHHVRQRESMLAEMHRILAPGGRLAITNIDPWCMPGWIVYVYFPAAWQRDVQDCLPVDELTERLEKLGFSNLQVERQHKQERYTLGEFLAYASQRYRTSQLMVISDRDYQQGLARLQAEVECSGDDSVVDSELCFVTVSGDRR